MADCMTQEDAMNMSNERAIELLRCMRDMMCEQHGCPISVACFAIDKAISALSAIRGNERGGSMTNADHLRALSDEELAVFLEALAPSKGLTWYLENRTWLDWLKKEPEEYEIW